MPFQGGGPAEHVEGGWNGDEVERDEGGKEAFLVGRWEGCDLGEAV